MHCSDKEIVHARIIGRAMRTDLVMDIPRHAPWSRPTRPYPVFHSVEGSQHGSGVYRQIRRQAAMRQSMSARAKAYHKARTESFIGTLKIEMLQDACFTSPVPPTLAPANDPNAAICQSSH